MLLCDRQVCQAWSLALPQSGIRGVLGRREVASLWKRSRPAVVGIGWNVDRRLCAISGHAKLAEVRTFPPPKLSSHPRFWLLQSDHPAPRVQLQGDEVDDRSFNGKAGDFLMQRHTLTPHRQRQSMFIIEFCETDSYKGGRAARPSRVTAPLVELNGRASPDEQITACKHDTLPTRGNASAQRSSRIRASLPTSRAGQSVQQYPASYRPCRSRRR